MEQIVSVPKNRIGLIVGKGGKVKKQIETQGKTKLLIKEDTIIIKGESLDVMKTSDVVKAIALGFIKDFAFELFLDEVQLTIFNLTDTVRESQLKRICGRIIGEKGKVKTFLEEKLSLRILVTSEKVAAIGDPMKIQILREVLEKLVKGATHSNVYRYLDRRLAVLENL